MVLAGWLLVLLLCLFLVVKSADYFTEYSQKLGLLLGLSSFIIGATIVAVGTSLPELVSSLYAVLDAGVTEFVADTVIGSNIANSLLILGLGAIYARTMVIETSLIDVDLPFFFMSMAMFVYFALDGTISVTEGILLLLFFVAFLAYTITSSRSDETTEVDKEEMEDLEKKYAHKHHWFETKTGRIVKYASVIFVSMTVMAVSAKYLIDSLLQVSELLHVQSSLLTITIVALGTSLPEVLTSVAAVRRGNAAIAIGNVFGSNTFNVLMVAGLPALFGDLNVALSTASVALPYLVVATFAAIFAVFDNKVRMWEGVALLFMYVVFVGKIIGFI